LWVTVSGTPSNPPHPLEAGSLPIANRLRGFDTPIASGFSNVDYRESIRSRAGRRPEKDKGPTCEAPRDLMPIINET